MLEQHNALDLLSAGGAGQLGDGAMPFRGPVTTVLGIPDALRVAAAGTATCARRGDGSVWCWGTDGSVGLRGLGYLTETSPTPRAAIFGLP